MARIIQAEWSKITGFLCDEGNRAGDKVVGKTNRSSRNEKVPIHTRVVVRGWVRPGMRWYGRSYGSVC